jgi:Mg2+ and Co2+ transporter CorA
MQHAEELRDDLAFIDRMIAECQQHIMRLKKTSAEMSRDGQDTELARDVLASFAAALTRHEAQRRLIVTLMQRHAEPQAKPARTRKKLQNA